MNDSNTTIERGGVRAARGVIGFALVCAFLFAGPRQAGAMAVDGALITNTVAATYHSLAGLPPTGPGYSMSYLASASVLVSCPQLIVSKRATPTTWCYIDWWTCGPETAWGAPGGLVTFQLCTINTALDASAFNVTLTDRYDQNVMWNNEETGLPLHYVLPYTYDISRSADAVSWTDAAPVAGTSGPYYVRWTFPVLGPGRSVCVAYTVEVK